MSEEVDIEAVDAVNLGSDESETIDIEDPFAGPRQELKELRSQLLLLRKSTKSAGKKQKKGLQEELVALEALINSKREALEVQQRQAACAALVMEKTCENVRIATQRIKKQFKKDIRREVEARQKEHAEAVAAQMPQLRRLERESLEKTLSLENLSIFEIEPDGNCLFNAISHQLSVRYGILHDQKMLRSIAAKHIRENSEKYVNFLEQDETVDEYSLRVQNTELWGGHLELDALCCALKIPIIIYQADTIPITFGVELDKAEKVDKTGKAERVDKVNPLYICFQKFAYSLGEHYDSLVDKEPIID